jgi:hypothetical protein
MRINLFTRYYRTISYSLATIFALVGLLFLLQPRAVLVFFNTLSLSFGMSAAPEDGFSFYLVLAVAYMYIVTLLAWGTGRHPEKSTYPFLLANAKIASSLVSFGFFFLHRPYLIFLSNGIIDGFLGLVALALFRSSKESRG